FGHGRPGRKAAPTCRLWKRQPWQEPLRLHATQTSAEKQGYLPSETLLGSGRTTPKVREAPSSASGGAFERPQAPPAPSPRGAPLRIPRMVDPVTPGPPCAS